MKSTGCGPICLLRNMPNGIMGKPYATEMDRLSETYTWALEVPIEPLAAAVSASATLPLLAVGSGGSFTAAHLACTLHQSHSGTMARPLTPLEFIFSSLHLGALGVMILSAGGTNTDIITTLENAVLRGSRRCMVLCFRRGSRLSRLAQAYRFVDLIDLDPPFIKDGFLATNSLLAFSVLLVRAYACAYSAHEGLPPRLEALFAHDHSSERYLHELRAACRPLWERETLVVLYGSGGHAAALDLESKFSEAALGNIQLADFRNFAHGRHNWIAKRGSKTAVLAIFTDGERDLAERTLQLIPPSIPVARIGLPGTGPTAMVAAMVAILHVVGAAGEQRKVDPGRPGVPAFGRRIYGLRALRASPQGIFSQETVAIARKLRCDVRALADRQDLPFWQEAYRRFVRTLQQTSFGAVIFDYDGTLCDEQDRFSGLRPDTVQHLTRLLQAGLPIGIATGRGRSVRDDLRRALPQELWTNVYLGYYNGAEIAGLADDMRPDTSPEPCESLKGLAAAVQEDPIISRVTTCEPRRAQVSIQPKSAVSADLAWRVIQQVVHSHEAKVLRSSHSIDLLRRDVSKCSLLAHLGALVREGTQVLVIGDKGQWPGNDCELLGLPYSLSVDEVSGDPGTCWNLALPGHRGVQAVLDYLDALRLSKGALQFDVGRLMAGKPSGRGRR